ncbi:LiaF transmembrane domain-containing protein [Sphingobacterium bovistauri]|uniref:LiaF transmembrane domain-containing protein n=1 Tax=Sphingobacterium bovistauri TaxID=2781959 RepID=A0ABS7ZBG3_9SPHI|nr:DUF5668 domain-containing protein [Sphingobacterium bovistauri]MCA5006220.1 hypothetical protein [Sphingobacterium bovistauri]
MKSKISTGIWLVFLGIIALLDNFSIIDFNFYAIIKYWPLLIVSLGINLIFQHKNYGTGVIIAVNIALCIFLTYVGYTSNDKFNWTGKLAYKNNIKDTSETEQNLSIPFTEKINNPKLTFNIGASKIKVDNNTTQLLEAQSESKNLGLTLDQSGNNIEISAVSSDKNAKNHFVNLSLSDTQNWILAFNIGAAQLTADLSSHKIEKLEINSGAANVNIKLGQPTIEKVKVEINTAASNTKISIPKDAACAVDMTTILSNNNLQGFIKRDDMWVTDNYDTASKKYIIELNGAANSLKIDRY